MSSLPGFFLETHTDLANRGSCVYSSRSPLGQAHALSLFGSRLAFESHLLAGLRVRGSPRYVRADSSTSLDRRPGAVSPREDFEWGGMQRRVCVIGQGWVHFKSGQEQGRSKPPWSVFPTPCQAPTQLHPLTVLRVCLLPLKLLSDHPLALSPLSCSDRSRVHAGLPSVDLLPNS